MNMLNVIYKGIIALIIGFGANSFSIADGELLFDDEFVFDDYKEESGEWDDGSDIFGDNDINTEKSFSWLDLSVTQKYGVNPASAYSTAMERTELRLGTSGSVFDSGYGEVEIKAIKYWPSDSNNVIEATDIDVEKAFLQFSFDDWSAKLGRYTIGWGELEGGALDVINPSGGIT
ncbi:MAG: Tat pathway signal protein, partial [Gammaproteobacteria bacterium]|nr:Tat pathway signal protein [Gammaproteobacteria bacterium]